MQIQMRETWLVSYGAQIVRLAAGCIYEVPRQIAASLIQRGRAIAYPVYPNCRSLVMMKTYRPRRVVRSSDPAVEPVSLNEAKSFLRIDSSDEDSLLAEMIKAARIAAEEQTGKSLVTQSWQLWFDACAPAQIALPHGPVQSVTTVKSVDQAGTQTVLSAEGYYLNAVQELVFSHVPAGHQVVIEYVAGYGNAASDVPTDLAQAILLHVAHLYEHRDSLNPPFAAQLFYSQHCEVRL